MRAGSRRPADWPGRDPGEAPHIILFPEIAFERAEFLDKVKFSVEKFGYCVVVVSEGVRNPDGKFLAEAGTRDAFGHAQLGGVGPLVAQMTQEAFGYKFHWAVADYLQRSARHIASKVDVEQAYAVGKAAVELAITGQECRDADDRPQVLRPVPVGHRPGAARHDRQSREKGSAPLHHRGRLGITAACRRYLLPLIGGEDTRRTAAACPPTSGSRARLSRGA